jgi:hypothetical protein
MPVNTNTTHHTCQCIFSSLQARHCLFDKAALAGPGLASAGTMKYVGFMKSPEWVLLIRPAFPVMGLDVWKVTGIKCDQKL